MKLKELRQAKKLTQIEIATELEVSRTTVSMWEIGAALPRADKLIKLADILGCTVDELLKER